MKLLLAFLLAMVALLVHAIDDENTEMQDYPMLEDLNENVEPRRVEDINGLSEEMLTDAINEAKREILDEEEMRKPRLRQDVDQSMQAKHYRRGHSPALEPVRIDAMVKERTIKKLAQKLEMNSKDEARLLEGLENPQIDSICKGTPNEDPDNEVPDGYRTIDGKNNNLLQCNRGRANTPFIRLIKPQYGDGISSPRKAANGGELPNARRVSRTVFKDKNLPSQKLAHMAMIFGQFLDHDITLAAQPAVSCSENCGFSGECFGIPILPGDTPFNGRSCIDFKRDVPFCSKKGHRREQINTITSFIDGGAVYSNDPEHFKSLRDPKDTSLLIERRIKKRKNLLSPQKEGFCRSPNQDKNPCFRAGDERTNENSGLASMHTIWNREHNRIVKQLKKIDYKRSKDELFFEARKIVGAMIQHITYNEFLPAILDDELRDKFKLVLKETGHFKGYKKNLDPSILNAFGGAAYRFGHSMVQNEFNRFLKSYNKKTTSIPTNRFFDTSFLYQRKKGGVDSILRGLAKDKAQRVDRFFSKAVQEELVREKGDMADLPALNIQRGRDHGLPGYLKYRNKLRKYTKTKQASTFEDLRENMNGNQIRVLKNVYTDVKDVDLFVGGMYERAHGNGVVGPTFSVIIAEQFRRLRLGDRFWYENPTQFSLDQLKEIRKVSLAKVICDNSDGIEKIRRRTLEIKKEFVECDKIEGMDLKDWKSDYGASGK